MTSPDLPDTTPAAPPTPWLLGYRLLGLRLPDEYRTWVAYDVTSRWFLPWRIGRTVLWFVALIALFWVGQGATHQPPSGVSLIRLVLIGLAVALLSSGKVLVRRTLRWQRVDRHGRPTSPKGVLAQLNNLEAVTLGAATLVLFTGAMGLFGYAQRPTGVAGIPCKPADADTMRRIEASLRSSSTELSNAQAIPFGDNSTMIAAVATFPDQPQPRVGIFIDLNGKLTELRGSDSADTALTSLDTPRTADRLAGEALRRALQCLSEAR